MDTILYLRSITQAILQMFILGAIGFLLFRRKIITSEGLSGLATFLIDVSFPALIFYKIAAKFSFELYRNWWVFFIFSLWVTGLGLLVGCLFSYFQKDAHLKREFISMVGFQNSGYLPLVLLGYIVPGERLDTALIYLFLFLIGFNLIIWSWGVHYLSANKSKFFSFASLFSMPVVATLLGFVFVLLRLKEVTPNFILSPIEMLGQCSFPLAIFVVGASLAELTKQKKIDFGFISKLMLAKLIILPCLGLIFLKFAQLPYLMGLLLIIELAVPTATSLVIIVKRYGTQGRLISQGVFISHIVSLITLPLFLILYNLVVLH